MEKKSKIALTEKQQFEQMYLEGTPAPEGSSGKGKYVFTDRYWRTLKEVAKARGVDLLTCANSILATTGYDTVWVEDEVQLAVPQNTVEYAYRGMEVKEEDKEI